MNTKLGFVTKVMLLSAVCAVLIKFGGPVLPISGTNAIALTVVVFPSLILAVLLGWRGIKILKE